MTSQTIPTPRNFVSRHLVWLLLGAVLVLNFAIRWHLREVPLERDEGEYAYAGQLLLQGIPPYQIAWNMKFPGTYFAYAVLMAIFGQTATGIHIGIILITSLTAVLMFFIGRKLLSPAGGLLTAFFFVLLTALPGAFGLAGHATHFVVLCVCAGTLALLHATERKSWLWTILSGAAFGLAILMKQHAVVFAVAAALYLAGQKNTRRFLIFYAGCSVPLLVTAIALAAAGVWHNFVLWTIQYAHQYVSLFPLVVAPRQFLMGFGPVFDCGAWIWLAGLAALALLFFPNPFRRAAAISGGLFLAGVVATIPGFYFRGHYFLMVMPGLALLGAACLCFLAKNAQTIWRWLPPICLFGLVTGDIVIRNAPLWFASAPAEVSRSLYGNNPFAESPEIAGYIGAHTKPTDTIAVLGSEPQIFFLSHRHSATGYIYLYPLTEPQPMAQDMRADFEAQVQAAQPRYIVRINNLSSWRSVEVPGQTRQILDSLDQWWNNLAANYQLVGAEDTADDGTMQFYWDAELANRTNSQPPGISIYRHN